MWGRWRWRGGGESGGGGRLWAVSLAHSPATTLRFRDASFGASWCRRGRRRRHGRYPHRHRMYKHTRTARRCLWTKDWSNSIASFDRHLTTRSTHTDEHRNRHPSSKHGRRSVETERGYDGDARVGTARGDARDAGAGGTGDGRRGFAKG